MSSEILTITLNPAVDKNFFVQHLLPDHKLRCPNPTIYAGGGGINVSKAIKRLGGKSVAVFTCGGFNGQLLKKLVQQEALDFLPIQIDGETRESIIINEGGAKHQYRIVIAGPTLQASMMQPLETYLHQNKNQFKYIIATGSLPQGLPEDYYAQLARITKANGAKFIVDTSGKPLEAAAEEGVFLIKPSLKELCELVGVKQLELNDVDDAARLLIAKGKTEVVVVSLGGKGALLVTKNEEIFVTAPIVESKSTVGAGDSMVGGMVWALQQGKSMTEIIRTGVACGSASTMYEGTQLFKKEDVDKLLLWMR